MALPTGMGGTVCLGPRRNPVGVEGIDFAQTQGRRGAPTLGWVRIPRWGRAFGFVRFENVRTLGLGESGTTNGERVRSPEKSEPPPPGPASVRKCGHGRPGAPGRFRDAWDEWRRTWAFSCRAEPIRWLHAIRPHRRTEETRVNPTSPRSGFVQPGDCTEPGDSTFISCRPPSAPGW